MGCDEGVSHGMDSNGMRAIAADLRNKDNCKINPATDNTLEELRELTDTSVLTLMGDTIKELKKMNLYLSIMTDHEFTNKDVEV